MEEIPKSMNIPPELEFKPSEAEPLKIGVWSKCDIDKGEKYGPFVGERKKLSAVLDDTYSWEIRGPKGRRLFSVDASDPSKGNWMRYVKSARYYEEQNMIAVQEDKNIFYKSMRIIPKGEELLCWYKGEKQLPKGERSSTKIEGSKDGITDVSLQYAGKCDSNIDNVDHTKCSEEKLDDDKMISLTTQESSSQSEVVQGACIRLSGLTDSIQKIISSTSHGSDVEIRSREPVVRLVPLSAEIKLKVHLDLDIHLDSELKTKIESREDGKTTKPEWLQTQQIRADKSSKFEANAVVTYENLSDFSKHNALSLPTTSVKGESNTVTVPKETCSTCSSYLEDKVKIDPRLSETAVKPEPSESKTALNNDRSLPATVVKAESNETIASLKANTSLSHSKLETGLDLSDVTVKTDQYESNGNLVISHSKVKVDPSSSETSVKATTSLFDTTLETKDNVSETVDKTNSITNDTTVINGKNITANTVATRTSSSETTVKTVPCSCETDDKPRSGSKLQEQIHLCMVEVKKESTCPRSEESMNTISQELIDSVGVKNELQCQEEMEEKTRDTVVEDEVLSVRDKSEDKTRSNADKSVDVTRTVIEQKRSHEENIVSRPEKKRKFLVKKRKRFRCQQCSREFRKPFQLKMHIIRSHEKRERKFKGYKISKRETIRTRSVSYLETATHEACENSLSNEVIANNQQTDVSNKEANNCESKTVSAKAQPSQTVSHSTSPVEGDHLQDIEEIESEKESFECPRCRRSFQYKSWLNRHIMVHEKNDYIEKKSIEQTTEKKVKQDTVEKIQKEQVMKSNFLSEFHIPKYDNSKFVEPQSKQFSCSECGKRFTTKKNTRRHKRLIHNILVRPDRTKLHYSNYTVEKPNRTSNLKTPIKVNFSTKKVVKSGKGVNRSEHRTKAHSTKADNRQSSGISVRLFNPSQVRLSEQPTVPQTKIQWRVASTRTGPPPAVASVDTEELYRLNVEQEAKFTGLGVRNPWVGTRKPKPFIPKGRKTKSDKSKAYANVEARRTKLADCIKPHTRVKAAGAIGSFDLSSKNYQQQVKISSSRIKIKEESASSSDAVGNSAGQSILNAFHTHEKTFSTNMKRNFQESNVEKDHPRVEVSLKLKQDPKSLYKPTATCTYAPSPTQIQPLASNVNIPKMQPHSVSRRTTLPELEARIRILQNEVARSEGTLLQHTKAEKLSSFNPKHTQVCNVCTVGFASSFALNQHVSIHADSWPYKCEVCVQLFKMPQELMHHRKSHHAVDGTQFINEELLEQHKDNVHKSKINDRISTETSQPIVSSSTYTCTKCTKQFLETSAFHSHIIDCASDGKEI